MQVHFDRSQFYMAGRRNLLRRDAVPTIFGKKIRSRTLNTLSSQSTVTASSQSTISASETGSRYSGKVSSMQDKIKALEKELQNEKMKNKCLMESLEKFLHQDQIKWLQLRPASKKVIVWSDKTIKSSLQTRFACGVKGYSHLRQLGYPLPAYSTLYRRLEKAPFAPGVQLDMLEWLKSKMGSQGDSEKLVILSMDEMQLEPRLEFDRGQNLNLF